MEKRNLSEFSLKGRRPVSRKSGGGGEGGGGLVLSKIGAFVIVPFRREEVDSRRPSGMSAKFVEAKTAETRPEEEKLFSYFFEVC